MPTITFRTSAAAQPPAPPRRAIPLPETGPPAPEVPPPTVWDLFAYYEQHLTNLRRRSMPSMRPSGCAGSMRHTASFGCSPRAGAPWCEEPP
jgi:hypothetical protein